LIITHFHPDHLGGISSMDGVVAFPNAVHHIHSVELNFLKNTSGTPLDDFINAANGRLQPIEAASQLQTFEADAELLPGVFAVHTPGHTPGHIALRLSSGDAQAMATLDVANHVVLALSRPDWYFGFDADPAAAVETRKSVFGMLADEKIQVVGYHFPFPGVGMIARDGEGFRYFGA
jgi:glyoxylase-like metal-dependent hydrolase (beta-lactamase superfamily II)